MSFSSECLLAGTLNVGVGVPGRQYRETDVYMTRWSVCRSLVPKIMTNLLITQHS